MLLPDTLAEVRAYLSTAAEAEVIDTVVTTLKQFLGKGVVYLAFTEWIDGLPERLRLTEEQASHELDADWWKRIPPSPSTPVLIRLTERGKALAVKIPLKSRLKGEGEVYIIADPVDKAGRTWKVCNMQGQRLGTYTWNLQTRVRK